MSQTWWLSHLRHPLFRNQLLSEIVFSTGLYLLIISWFALSYVRYLIIQFIEIEILFLKPVIEIKCINDQINQPNLPFRNRIFKSSYFLHFPSLKFHHSILFTVEARIHR